MRPLALVIAALGLLVPADLAAGAPGADAASSGAPGRSAAAPAIAAAARGCGATCRSRRPLAERSGWRRYVLDDQDGVVYPRRVSVVGDGSRIANPGGLKAPGGGVTTITASGRGEPRLVLDLGLNTVGWVEVGVARGDGATVRVAYSESRRELDEDGDFSGNDLTYSNDPDARSEEIVSRPGGPTRWRSPGVRAGVRWMLVQLQGAGTASIDYVRIHVTSFRPQVDDYVGRFLSDDDLLNRQWYAGAYTYNAATRSDLPSRSPMVITDGIKRDGLLWEPDLFMNATSWYTTRQAPKLLRNSLRSFSCQQYPDGYLPMATEPRQSCLDGPGPPDGPPDDPDLHVLIKIGRLGAAVADWPIALDDYLQHTGDRAFARRMLPVARRTAGFFAAHSPRGLYVTGKAFGGVEINWHPFDTAAGEDGYTNGKIYEALRALARLERRVGAGPAAAGRWERQARGVRERSSSTSTTRRWAPSGSTRPIPCPTTPTT